MSDSSEAGSGGVFLQKPKDIPRGSGDINDLNHSNHRRYR